MPILEEKLRRRTAERKAIEQKVRNEPFKPTPEELEYAHQVMERISDEFAQPIAAQGIDALKEEITKAVNRACLAIPVSRESQLRIAHTALSTMLGLGPIQEYLDDPKVTEIVVQRYDNIVVERAGKIQKVDTVFSSEEQLKTIINRIVQGVNRQVNITAPIVDARLQDGSRVNATIPPVSPDGSTLTIRKFNQRALTGEDYLNAGSLSRKMLYFLERCVTGRITIFVSGGTGTGKTTMLNMLSQFVPKDELIITIEDTLELKLQQPNIRRMEVRRASSRDMMDVDQNALVKAALRQRPDRIILGETRDGSIVDLISAMSTGHEGSMSTIHANSAQSMCDVRVPILYSMNPEANFSEKSIALQLAEAIQISVQLSRLPDGSRKVTEIAWVDGVTSSYKVNCVDLFRYNIEENRFEATGVVPDDLIRRIRMHGLDFDESIFEKGSSGPVTSRTVL